MEHNHLHRCVFSSCHDQIQGRIFFDFFLFYSNRHCSDDSVGELALLETLIESRKERFLTHPVAETFLKLKWYRTWRLYMVILVLYAVFVVSVVGYSLAHFGSVMKNPLDAQERNGWWWALATTSTYMAGIELAKVRLILVPSVLLRNVAELRLRGAKADSTSTGWGL